MRFQVLAAALIVSLGASAAALSAPGGGVRARPDLVVNSLANPPAVVSAGDGFSARDRTRNIGKATALARRSVGLLKPGRSSAGSVAATVPLTLDTGAYSLVACADAPGAVMETSEKNNCRTAATRIVIKKPPPRV
jgi:CARDB